MRSLLLAALLLAPARAWGICSGPTGGREGQCAAEFTLPAWPGGAEVRLSAFAGKVVFLNFWASWCEPCRVELPALEELYHRMEKENFVILSVSIDAEGAKAVDRFFGGKKPPYPVALDGDQKISKKYGTFKVPETYVIDREGRIRDKVEGIRNWGDSLLVHYFQLLARP